MIRIQNINKKYSAQEVLKNINLGFREKELVMILGPSGSGKTTLLNVMAGIEKSDAGDVYYGCENISKYNGKKLDYYRSNNISYIFQDYNLINYLTVDDNLLISSKLKGKKLSKESINAGLNTFGLYGSSKKTPLLLSGGEKQRVAILKSLLCDSKVLFGDEPTGALDSCNAEVVMDIFKEISRDRLVILVTHNEELAKKYADRIIRLKDGIVEEDTNPYFEKISLKYNIKKTRLNYFSAVKMAMKNLSTKKSRTYLTVLAFSVGLISLGLVLSLSKGFKQEIKTFEEKSLYNYPLIISEKGNDVNKAFTKKEEYQEGIINIREESSMEVTNKIDEELLSRVKKLDSNLVAGVSLYKKIDDEFIDYSIVNPTNDYFNLLFGNFPDNKKEVLLLLDSNNSISKSLAKYLKIVDENYESIIGKKIIVNKKTLKIVGIVQSDKAYFTDLSGILYSAEAFDNKIKDIYIFPQNYESKQKINELLKDYNIIDDSKTVVDLTSTFINGISYVLIAFSFISLFVSIIMIAIISYISVLERYKEIGILKTMGATARDIKRLFLSENILIGLLSSVISLEIISFLAKIINKYVVNEIGIKNIIVVSKEIIILMLFISITLTYIAGLIPARIASRKKVIDILKT